MITTFHNKRITGMLAVFPETLYDYDEETADFATPKTRRLKKVMGFGSRRAAKATTTNADFCEYALQQLIDDNLIDIKDVGAIIVTRVCPDHFIPHNSNIIHGKFGFSEDVYCVDIPQGCCGFMMGFFQACMLLDHMPGKKALVFATDILNRKDPKTKLTAASFGGDACTLTVVENDPDASDIYFSIYNDGANREALIRHAGAYRMPSSPETAIPVDMGHGDGEKKPYDALWMNGSMVFNFVQKEVPIMFDKLSEYSGISKDEIEAFFFHQPNRFMLEKLADRMGVPREKMPMDIVTKYGNSSGATVPVAITTSYGERLLNEKVRCCMSGFGSGLTWTGAILELGNLDFCKNVISNL